jgi:hypothetical protein
VGGIVVTKVEKISRSVDTRAVTGKACRLRGVKLCPIVAFAVALCQLASSASTAFAAEAPPPPPEAGGTTVTPVPTRRDPIYHHAGQLGLSVMPGVGYALIIPYEEDIDCGDADGASKRVCANRTPVFVDLQAAFGVSTRLDLVVDVRLGLEKGAMVGRQFALMPGLRIWLDQDVNVKFYTTIQGVFDNTDQETVSDNDFGFRNANGLMYDVIRNVGFFFQFGETFGFKRWFRVELDVGLGVQVRFP